MLERASGWEDIDGGERRSVRWEIPFMFIYSVVAEDEVFPGFVGGAEIANSFDELSMTI